jgi:putative ABC transport system permease protein
MLLFLYRRRLRAHPIQELLAGGGVAIGVALVFGVLLANTSLTASARELVRGLAGSARYELLARSSQGFDEHLVEEAGNLPGVQVASPLLRQNVTLSGPHGEEAVQLIGVTQSLEALGGVATQNLGAAETLRTGGVGLPSEVASTVGARVGSALRVSSDGAIERARMKAQLRGEGLDAISASPVAVTLLPIAQRLAHAKGRVTQVLIQPRPGQAAKVRAELQRLAGSRLEVRPADAEIGLLEEATKPNRQSTTLFTVIAVMIGFLLALSAILLTVPERRRFIAELRMQGYDPGQVMLLLGFQALVLGVVASLVGIALGDVLSRAFFQRVPAFLSAAFPLGTKEVVHTRTVLLAIGAGVLATLLASIAPLLDLRAGRPADAVFSEVGSGSEIVGERTIRRFALAGTASIAIATALALLLPGATIVAGVVLAVAMLCLIPGAFSLLTRALPWAGERIRSSALVVALTELRATTMRSVALAAIVALAVYGGVAIGGARKDLLSGVSEATAQYFATAQLWVTSGRDVFNTNGFAAQRPAALAASVPGVASVRVYQGGLLDVGRRRMWVRARPPQDSAMFESSQLVDGYFATASRRIREGGWAAISSGFADERHLGVGDAFTLPTPDGPRGLKVAAIVTNSGWPPGAITLSTADYRRWWRTDDAAALEISLKPGVQPAAARLAVKRALGAYPGLQVRTASERAALSAASARQGLRTLQEISTLLLVAAALAVAAALSAAIWQRRERLAALKVQGYDPPQLWRAVLLESAITIAVGAIVGAVIGIFGHALASRFLERSTGFPAPFSLDLLQVLLTLALLTLISLLVIALPGGAAARVEPTAIFQE